MAVMHYKRVSAPIPGLLHSVYAPRIQGTRKTEIFAAREAFLYLGERIFKQVTSLRVRGELDSPSARDHTPF